jgi:hypothetical protein
MNRRRSLTTGPAVLYALLWSQALLWGTAALGFLAATMLRTRYGPSSPTADVVLVAAVAATVVPAALARRFRYLSGRGVLIAYQVVASALALATRNPIAIVLATLGWVFLLRDDTKAYFGATKAMP